MPSKRRLAAITFTDIVGYTAMMQRDEADALERLKRYRKVLSEQVEAHDGSILQHYGDGSLCIFDSAVEAVACAREVQRILSREAMLRLRTGVHLGDVVLEEHNIFGDGVNLAARVESLAAPQSILLTERIAHDLRSHPQFKLVSLGRFLFKNASHPLEVFALAEEGLNVPSPKEIRGKVDVAEMVSDKTPASRHMFLPLAIAILSVVAGFLTYHFWPRPAAEVPPPSIVDQRAIAVLPFSDLSPEGDQTYFGDGIAEEILHALAQVEGLKVAGRSSSFAFRATQTDLRQIAEKLGVAAVLEGSVRRADNQVRVSARLVNTQNGYQMWSQSYQRAWEDIFAIQDEIAKAVADNLKVILIDDGSRTLVKPLTDNREAYEWYLRGRYMLSQRSDGAEKSAQFFREALRRDSSFTAAYAGLGHAYLWLGWGNYRPSHIAFDSARHYAREALRRDSLSSYAHYIHGAVHLWYDWDWDKARAALEKALSLNTAEASAYLDRGWLHAVGGDFSAAIEQMRKAVELDPLNLEFNLDMADLHRMARQYPQALEIAKAMLEVYPDNSDAHWMVGMIEFTRRNYAEALPHFRRAVLLSQDDDWSRIHLAMALVKAPETRAEGVALLQELTNQKDLDTQAPVELALAFASLGDRNKALDLLELSYQLHANWLISLKIEPLWDELRQENRFRALSRRMRFPNPR